MRTEFVFSVEQIFGSVLKDADASHYYIGPYQRGYKWSSKNYYDQVPQLLMDVYNAWQKSRHEGDKGKEGDEYFLQYITVLRRQDEDTSGYFEVIDGQQRLTTLAIIFERLNNKSQGTIESLGRGKLKYARGNGRDVLFDIIGEYKDNISSATQDRFYIHSAVKCVDIFISLLSQGDELGQFAQFFAQNVKIILNRESDFVTPEEVFVNLNGNSVELTNAYLIKGLILTKSVEREGKNGLKADYGDLVEQRKINGRMWDEIQNWVQQREVSHFFFGKEAARDNNGMERLLELVLKAYTDRGVPQTLPLLEEFKGKMNSDENSRDMTSGFRLFNRFNEVVVTDKDGIEWMHNIKHVYKKLRSWYEQVDMYNLLGYILFADKTKSDILCRFDIQKQLLFKSEKVVRRILSEQALDILPDLENGDIYYNDRRLTPLLLSFSVYPEGKPATSKFNFQEYDEQRWTYEHIRPQNPKSDSLKIDDFSVNQIEQLYRRQIECRQLCELRNGGESKLVEEVLNETEQEIETLSQIKKGEILSLDNVDFLYGNLGESINSMGNMALLSNTVNSSIGNKPYILKRAAVRKKIDEGYFVPQHTSAVFSKALDLKDNSADDQFDVDQLKWEENDVKAHAEWMRIRNKEIRSMLNKNLN